MTCEHKFVPFPGSLSKLYCERCGNPPVLAVKEPKPPQAPRRRTREPEAPGLPFGITPPIGNGRSPISAEGEQLAPEVIAQLERDFGLAGGASPMSQAATLNELAKTLGLQRQPDGDPPGTYRPGTEEVPPWLKSPQ